jgi:PAS domain S-box-containing protein
VYLPVVAVTPLMLFAALLAISATRTEQAERRQAMTESARALAFAVDDYLAGAVSRLELIASARLLEDDAARRRPLREEIVRLMPLHEGWRQVIVATPAGALVSSTGPADEADRVLASAGSLLTQASEQAATVISGPLGWAGPQERTFALASSVWWAGRAELLVVAAMDASGLDRILRRQPLPAAWTAAVVDRNGRVVGRFPDTAPIAAAGAPAPLLPAAAGAEGWQRGVDGSGVSSYLAFQRGPQSGWGAVVSISEAAMDGPVRHSVAVMLAAGLACLAVGAVLAAIVGRQLARPLGELAEAAADLERGGRPVIPAHPDVEEIAALGRGLAVATDAEAARAAALRDKERATQESEAWHAALAALAPVGLVRVDGRGRVTYVNERWSEITGLSLPEVQDGGWERHVHPDDRALVLADWAEAQEDGVEFHTECRLTTPAEGGGPRWLAVFARALRDGSGQVVEYVGVTIDITERRQMEQERSELISRARTGQLEAEAANQAKDDFLAALSHELRTPLNAMLLWVQVLHETEPDPALYARALDAIARSARQQAKLIEDLLDVARLSSGKFTVDLRPVDLVAVVRAALETVVDEIERKAIVLTRDFAVASCRIVGDPARLQQVVLNLLSNAIRFTPRDGQIAVGIGREEGQVVLSVRDNGEGIAPALTAQIFERFRQAERGLDRRHSGLGLGLAIARDIVELHGGRITASSDGRGMGSTFTVTLPVPDQAALPPGAEPGPDVSASLAASGEATGGEPPRLDGATVLLVEDNDDSRELVTRALERHGAVVVSVASAREALEAVSRQRPDVLVSDIGMANMDGYELMRRLRDGDPSATVIPAVALTGYASAGDRDRALAVGFHAHLPKPVDTLRLAEVVAGLVKPR